MPRPFFCNALLALLGLAAASVLAVDDSPPPQRYSFYSPGRGTVNFLHTSFEPQFLRLHGRRIGADDLIVLTSTSKTLLRVSSAGRLVWSLDVKAGGGARALASYGGRLLVGVAGELWVVSPANGRVLQRLPLPELGGGVANGLRVQGHVLVMVDGQERVSRISLFRLSRDSVGFVRLDPIEHIDTRTSYPRDALLLSDDTLAVADTFGHAVVFYRKQSRWREVRRMAEFYPNMLGREAAGLLVLSEHGNRLGLWDVDSDARQVLLACPAPLFQDGLTKPPQILAEEVHTATAETPPRQLCSADVAGPHTLYSPNGFFHDAISGQTWVADTDNHRVALFEQGRFVGAISGINDPVRVLPVSKL